MCLNGLQMFGRSELGQNREKNCIINRLEESYRLFKNAKKIGDGKKPENVEKSWDVCSEYKTWEGVSLYVKMQLEMYVDP